MRQRGDAVHIDIEASANKMGMLRTRLRPQLDSALAMSYPRPRTRNNPKISTMPRQQSESAHYLNAYKLTIEKKRLHQELTALDQKRQLIEARLQVLDQGIQANEQQAQALKAAIAPQPVLPEPNSVVYAPIQAYPSEVDAFKTVTLDY